VTVVLLAAEVSVELVLVTVDDAVVGLVLVELDAVTMKLSELEVPPPGAGVATLTWAAPALAMSVAEMLAWSRVLLT